MHIRDGTVAMIAQAFATLPATAPQAEPLTDTSVSPRLLLVVRFDTCDTAPEDPCGRLLRARDTKLLPRVKPRRLILSGMR
ncbi:MAG: hypothetical protein JJ897_21470 [Marinibacterium sp.]|nr:hypothetical protein [Marinibacterium sp.]